MPTIVCSYCGNENSNLASRCGDCGTELPRQTENPRPQPVSRLVEEQRWAAFFSEGGAFTQADWPALERFIETEFPLHDRSQARHEAVIFWAESLARDLGGEYRVTATRQLVCLADFFPEYARRVVHFAGHIRSHILGVLLDLAWGGHPEPLLVFLGEEDDYYGYISQYHGEGTHILSAGVQIRTGYPQIVIHTTSWHDALHVLVHEMSHACVAHLPLPRWLDEAVAQTLEQSIGEIPPPDHWTDRQIVGHYQSQWTPPVLTDEMAERHHAFWDEERLQRFWAGTSFGQPGDESELSYHLALVLLHLITSDHGNWLDFVAHAHYDDGGQTAALDCFGVGLGEIVGTFLGEGQWRPVRKQLVNAWKQAGWEE